jgi:hypothetical protein
VAWHPDAERLVISFSVNDSDPCVAVVAASDVRGILLDIAEHQRASSQVAAGGWAVLEMITSSDTSVMDWNARSVASAGPNGSASSDEYQHTVIERDKSREIARPHLATSVLERVNLEYEFREIEKKGLFHLTDLCHLMSSFGSDKGNGWHNYTVVYDGLFSKFRNEELALFELGLGTNKVGAPSSMGTQGRPGASLRGWRAYFPRARIYGADIDADILFQEDRISTFWTDQREPRAISALWERLEDVAFDIMVDDGLHEASANIRFFLRSLEKLRPGGIYVIEDIALNDTDLVRSFARRIARFSKSIVCEAIDHPVNKLDNRLLIFQKA